jgi:hypothetical protein
MKMYWIKFQNGSEPSVFNLGAGVTALSKEDVFELLKPIIESNFDKRIVSEVKELTSVSELDQHHVIPNMGNPSCRGVWFPLGYS